VRELERAVELRPQDSVINDHLGDAYWRAGRKLEARFQWRHAQALGPEPAEFVKIEDKLANGLPNLPGKVVAKVGGTANDASPNDAPSGADEPKPAAQPNGNGGSNGEVEKAPKPALPDAEEPGAAIERPVMPKAQAAPTTAATPQTGAEASPDNGAEKTQTAAVSPVEGELDPAATSVRRYIVRPGETLWVLAERFYGNGWAFRRIVAANKDKLRHPDRIRPGLELVIPDAE
jgi:nucleoid-associated protein YgaU